MTAQVRFGISVRQCEPDLTQAVIVGGSFPDLKEIQDAVDGFIECVPTSQEITLWCNEEHKYNGMIMNPLATWLWSQFDYYGCVRNGDWLGGPILIQGARTRYGYCTREVHPAVVALFLNMTGWQLWLR